MESLTKALGTLLYWVQPKAFARWFELRTDDQQFATLGWETSCGSLARGSTADGDWTFKRVGFLNPRVTVREAGSEVNLATFWPRWLGDGTLEFAYGVSFRWQSTNFWGTDWIFSAADGTPLLALKEGSRDRKIANLFKTESLVEIHAEARRLTELPLLVLTGWYLMILRQEDAAAASAAS